MTDHPADEPVEFQFGVYRHHKGDRYVATAIVRMHDSRRPYVLYHPEDRLDRPSIRPLTSRFETPRFRAEDLEDCWDDAMPGGKPRFEFVEPLPTKEGQITVTVRDNETGEETSVGVTNNYALVCAGECYRYYVQAYPKSGTHIITVKGVRSS